MLARFGREESQPPEPTLRRCESLRCVPELTLGSDALRAVDGQLLTLAGPTRVPA